MIIDTPKSDYVRKQGQIIIVAKTGGDYTSIQDAIDSITDNSVNKPYTILIYPGVYTEDIVMEDFVSLEGVGDPATVIIYGTNSAPLLTFPADDSYQGLFNLTLSLAPTITGQYLISTSNGVNVVQNCNLLISSSTNGVVATVWSQTGGTCWLNSSYVSYTMTGDGVAVKFHSIFSISGNSDYRFLASGFEVNVDDANDTVTLVNENAAGTIGEGTIRENHIHVNLTNAGYTGISGVFYLHGSGTWKAIENNHVHITSEGDGTGYIFYMDTTAGGGVISANANRGVCEGFANNYAGNIADGDTLNASFVSLDAVGGFTGAGTVNAVASPMAGRFIVSGSLNIPSDAVGVSQGDIRYSTTDIEPQYYDGSNWHYMGSPKGVYIKETGRSAGNLNLTSTTWDIDKSLISMIKIVTTSDNWDAVLYPDDDFDESGIIPSMNIMTAGNTSEVIDMGNYYYIDADSSSELHMKITDNDSSSTFDIYCFGVQAK